MGPESVISAGVFGPGEQAQAYARLYGTVLRAEQRTVAATGQSFVIARCRTVGFEPDMCLPAMPLPTANNIIGGTVFLAASLTLDSPPPAQQQS